MMKSNLPYALSSLKVSTYSPSDEISLNYPGQTLFDSRSDFLVGKHLSGLAVLLNFANLRRLRFEHASGIRRNVAVVLIDDTDRTIIATQTLRVHIWKGELNSILRVDLPFSYANVEIRHTYKVEVRDETTGTLMGEKNFRLIDERQFGQPIPDCFTPEYGGFCPIGKNYFSKSDYAATPAYYNLLFYFREAESCIPDPLPEMEVRIYYPNGKVSVEFRTPATAMGDFRQHSIKLPFFVDALSLGICYAEIICLDYAIGGFAFSTDSHPLTEAFEGDELLPLDEYSLEAATDRFQATTTILRNALPRPYSNPHIGRENGGETPKVNDEENIDEFERLLRRFIAENHEPDEAED